jgi:CBS domain-containing protein
MHRPVETVSVDARLSEARRVLTRGNFHHVPVVDGRTLVGIVSAGDLLRVYHEARAAGRTDPDDHIDQHAHLRDIMSTHLVTVRDTDVVEVAIDAIGGGAIHSVLVLDESKHLVGIVTDHDLLDFLCE